MVIEIIKKRGAWDLSLNKIKVSSIYRLKNTGLKSPGHSSNHFFSRKHIKILAKVGPKGCRMPNPYTCLYKMELKIKKNLKQLGISKRVSKVFLLVQWHSNYHQ